MLLRFFISEGTCYVKRKTVGTHLVLRDGAIGLGVIMEQLPNQ